MPLLEIIKGEKTSDETLYRALDFAKQIKKTPIVVNDSRGFFTSRVIGTFINEGIAMLLEGDSGGVDRAGVLAGRLPGAGAPALRRAQPEAHAQDPRRHQGGVGDGDGGPWAGHPAEQVIDRMLDEFGRPGKLEGAGFYEYEDGKRTGLWKGLRDAFPVRATRRRSRCATSRSGCCSSRRSRAVKCLDEGVIESVADANIGSIMGIGFPAWTGGVLQYING